jgi:hypothetical protein
MTMAIFLMIGTSVLRERVKILAIIKYIKISEPC